MKKNMSYELWAIGFTKDEQCTDFEQLLAEFPYTEEGKQEALRQLREMKSCNIPNLPEEVALLDIVLEEVADFSDTERSAFEIAGSKWLEVDREIS